MKIFIAILFVLLAGCRERDEPLTNGYRFVELNHGNGAITKGSEFAVFPNVVEHQVRGRFVVGKRLLAQDNNDGSAPFESGLGYFVLDTATGQVRQGLPTPPIGELR